MTGSGLWGRGLACAFSLALVGVASAQTIRIWGHGNPDRDDMGSLVKAWETGFAKSHPGVKFENALTGNAAAIGGLYTGAAEMALIDRPPLAIEVAGYDQGAGHKPTGVAVAHGSVATLHHSPALMIVVPAGNPMKAISLEQLDAVFSADHRRGAPRVHTWGELGLTGAWAKRPVHPYGFGVNRVQSMLFEKAVMNGSQKWRDSYTEVGGQSESAPQQIVTAVSRDANAIGISSMDAQQRGVKVLAVREGDGDAVVPTRESVASGRYALGRTLYAYFNRDEKAGMKAEVRAFLEYVVSDAGQAVVAANGYLPLGAADAHVSAEGLAR